MSDQTISHTAVPVNRDSITTNGTCDLCDRKGVETHVITTEFRRQFAPKSVNPFLTGTAMHECSRDLSKEDRRRRFAWLYNNAGKNWNICERCADFMADKRDRYAAEQAAAANEDERTRADYADGYEGGGE